MNVWMVQITKLYRDFSYSSSSEQHILLDEAQRLFEDGV